jgi:hypothetical protein
MCWHKEHADSSRNRQRDTLRIQGLSFGQSYICFSRESDGSREGEKISYVSFGDVKQITFLD